MYLDLVEESLVKFTNVEFTHNRARKGGAVVINNANFTDINGTYSWNYGLEGAGFYIQGSSLTFSNTEFEKNQCIDGCVIYSDDD